MLYLFHYSVFFCIYFFIIFPLWKERTKANLFVHVIMFVYLLILLTMTVIPLPNFISYKGPLVYKSVNFIPFRDVFYGYTHAKREVLLNIIMMIPFGFLLPLAIQKQSLMTTLLTSICLSVSIETIQLFTIWFNSVNQRVPDITDVITNTTGGIIGYCFYRIILYVKKQPI